MLYPTINELTKNEFNRYELALGTAKCARLITEEYVRQQEAAEKEKAASGNKDADKTIIVKEYRDEKAVKHAITKIHSGEYVLVRRENTEDEAVAEESAEESAKAETAEENN